MKNRRNDVEKELDKISPFLAGIRKEDPGFRTPEGYFHNLTEEIMERVQHLPAPEPETENRIKTAWYEPLLAALQGLWRPRYALALATVAALLVAGRFWLRSAPSANAGEMVWSDLSVEEMTEYVENNIQDFELELLVEMAPGFEERSILDGAGINDEALDDYLEKIIEEVEMNDLEHLF